MWSRGGKRATGYNFLRGVSRSGIRETENREGFLTGLLSIRGKNSGLPNSKCRVNNGDQYEKRPVRRVLSTKRRKKLHPRHPPVIRSFVSTTNATVHMAALTVSSVHVAGVVASARAPVRAQRAVNAKAPARVSASAFMGGAERRALAVSARRAAPARGFEVVAQAISEVRSISDAFPPFTPRSARRVACSRVVPVDVARVISTPRQNPGPSALGS